MTERLVCIAPSREVDEGRHALILHTHLYTSLCHRLGRFVHHFPERPDPSRFDGDVLTRTIALIEQAGYKADAELWTGLDRSLVTVAANCNHTPVPGGCGPINPGGCATHGGGDGGEQAAPATVTEGWSMDADEARELEMTLRQLRIPGIVAPEDPQDPQGAWRVYDEADPGTRRDITADVLVAVAAARRRQGPTRGFVIPRAG